MRSRLPFALFIPLPCSVHSHPRTLVDLSAVGLDVAQRLRGAQLRLIQRLHLAVRQPIAAARLRRRESPAGGQPAVGHRPRLPAGGIVPRVAAVAGHDLASGGRLWLWL